MVDLIKKYILIRFNSILVKWYGRSQSKYAKDLTFSKATELFHDRNEIHAYMHHHFYNFCPPVVCRHREYFKKNQRGFGEDALHAMWYTLLKEFKPKECLEIGVYRGQVISLWALIADLLEYQVSIHGLSPFTASGDEVSEYLKEIDYYSDTLNHHKFFDLPRPNLVKALSTDEEGQKFIKSRKWDLIYIDGNHDYDVAKADYDLCKENLKEGGLLVMDDSSLNTDFKPPRFSFAGHPGPSKVVQEFAMKELCFIGGVGHNNVFIKKQGF